MKARRTVTLLAVTVILLIAGSLLQRLSGHYRNRDVDFQVYYFAGRAVHDNPKADIYTGALDGNPEAHNDAPVNSELYRQATRAGYGEVMMYLYPPVLADMLSPLYGMSPATAANVWHLINLSLVFISALLIARMLQIRYLSFPFLLLLAAAYSLFPIYEALALGQITIVLLVLWALSVSSYARGWIALSACALAFATTLKITPLLAVPVFLVWRDRKWLSWYFGTLLLLLVGMVAFNGVNTVETSLRVIGAMGGSVAALQNKCISSLLQWLYYGHFVPMEGTRVSPPRLLVIAEKLASLTFYVTCLFFVWRRRNVEGRFGRATSFAVFALVTVVVSPISWRHAYAIALVPLAILWVENLRRESSLLQSVLLAVATLSIGSLAFDLVALRPLPFAIQLLSGSVITVSTVLLCLAVLGRGTEVAVDAPQPR